MMGDSSIVATVRSAVDTSTGASEQLYKPIYIQIEKTQPRYVYGLRYLKDFAYNATETIIKESNFGCKDSLNEPQPTCGWQFDETGGGKIVHS